MKEHACYKGVAVLLSRWKKYSYYAQYKEEVVITNWGKGVKFVKERVVKTEVSGK